MFCYKCGNQIKDGAAFCSACGTKIRDSVSFCSNCGTKIENGAAFCPNCGTKQATTASSTNQQTYYAQPNAYAYANVNTEGSPKNVNFGEAIKLYFKNYANFTGRSTKSEYWWAFLFNYIASLISGFISVLAPIVVLGLLVPSIAVGVRRLHDTGKSWVYLLLGLIPIVGAILLIIQYCKESDADNQWGPAPRN